MDILITDSRFNNVPNFISGNEVGLTRLVDTINASEIVRDQFNALTNLQFIVEVTDDPTKPQAQAEPNGVIRLYLAPDSTYDPDVLFSIIAHEIRHPVSSLPTVPAGFEHLPHGEAVGQESAIWGYAADNQAQISSDPQFGAQLRDAYVAARYREEGRAELNQMEASIKAYNKFQADPQQYPDYQDFALTEHYTGQLAQFEQIIAVRDTMIAQGHSAASANSVAELLAANAMAANDASWGVGGWNGFNSAYGTTGAPPSSFDMLAFTAQTSTSSIAQSNVFGAQVIDDPATGGFTLIASQNIALLGIHGDALQNEVTQVRVDSGDTVTSALYTRASPTGAIESQVATARAGSLTWQVHFELVDNELVAVDVIRLENGVPVALDTSAQLVELLNLKGYSGQDFVDPAVASKLQGLLTAFDPALAANQTSGAIDNDFDLDVNPTPSSGSGELGGASDLGAQATTVGLGGVAGGGGWSITTDADDLNENQLTGETIDNASAAAYTQILADGNRPGNQNLASGWNLGSAPALDQLYAAIDLADMDLGAAMLNNGNQFAQIVAPTDPLVLDLNGDGVKLTDYQSNPVLFDADHDGGSLEQTGWVSPQDGIVVMDLNSNGVIDGIHETLSEYFNGTVGTGGEPGTRPYAHGFDALRSLDSNSDGVFNSSDAAWGNVRVWVDANHDGVSYVDVNANGVYDPGTDETELKTFAELDITQINLASTTQSGLVRDGNEVLASGTFVMDGQTREAIAANFLVNPNGHEFTASGNGTIVATEGGGLAAGVSSYVSHDAGGESIDVDAKGVRNAYGFTGDDTLIGDANNNWLAGGPGSDVFDAGAGDDVLLIHSMRLQRNSHAETRL